MRHLLLLTLLFLAAAATAQNSVRFTGTTSKQLPLTPAAEYEWAIFLRARSTSRDRSRAGDGGTYDRLFGTARFAVELADKNGALALYNGRSWTHTSAPIRREAQNILVTANDNRLTLIVGTDTIKSLPWARSTPLSRITLGSKYFGGEYFEGVLFAAAVYDRSLTTEEIAQLDSSNGAKAASLKPLTYLDTSATRPQVKQRPQRATPAKTDATDEAHATLRITNVLGDGKVMSGTIDSPKGTPGAGKYELTITEDGYITILKKDD